MCAWAGANLVGKLAGDGQDIDGHVMPAAKVDYAAQRGRDTPSTSGGLPLIWERQQQCGSKSGKEETESQ